MTTDYEMSSKPHYEDGYESHCTEQQTWQPFLQGAGSSTKQCEQVDRRLGKRIGG